MKKYLISRLMILAVFSCLAVGCASMKFEMSIF